MLTPGSQPRLIPHSQICVCPFFPLWVSLFSLACNYRPLQHFFHSLATYPAFYTFSVTSQFHPLIPSRSNFVHNLPHSLIRFVSSYFRCSCSRICNFCWLDIICSPCTSSKASGALPWAPQHSLEREQAPPSASHSLLITETRRGGDDPSCACPAAKSYPTSLGEDAASTCHGRSPSLPPAPRLKSTCEGTDMNQGLKPQKVPVPADLKSEPGMLSLWQHPANQCPSLNRN